jgi:phosphocarrier protein
MQKQTATLVNKLGLHARAAACFVKTASNYPCEISVRHGEKTVSGKSIMQMMMLAAARGTTLEITADGPREEEALKELACLIRNRFGEPE